MRTRGIFLIALLAILAQSYSLQRTADGAQADNAAPPNVHVTMKVYDKSGTVFVNATREVSRHSNAFDVMREIVQVDFKTYAGLGPFVTSIAGVKPPPDQFWALYIDGTLSQLGIGNITVDNDILIEWKLTDLQPHPAVGQRVSISAKIMDKNGKEIRNHAIEYVVKFAEK